jgi:FemAB-related protein (PEP-CTERM system-associated)
LLSRLETRVINPSEYQAWDRCISAHAKVGVYLTTAWKQAVETSYGHKNFYLGAFEGNHLAGVLPLVLIKPPVGRGCLVSLPYCDYGGLIAKNEVIATALLDRAVDLAGQMRAVLKIHCAEPTLAVQQRADFVQVSDKCRMLLELPQSATTLWDGFKSKLRSQVKRAMNNGLVPQIGGKELLQDFYAVFARNMRDLGSPVHSPKWLHAVLVAFGDSAKVGVVYKDAFPAAAGIVLTHGAYATIPWASSLREFDPLGPNMLLYWNFLKYASDSHFKFFDFGRSTPGEGTYAFKRQWGAEPSPLYWFRQGTVGEKKVRQGTGLPLRSALEWSWKKLPLAVANAVGPPIRKYISR